MRNLGRYALFLAAIMAAATYASSIQVVNPAGPSGLVGTDVVAKSFTSSQSSGANAFAVQTTGARVDFGPGTTDYFTSNGTTTVTAAGDLAVSAGLSIRNGSGGTLLNVGTAGTGFFIVTSGSSVAVANAVLDLSAVAQVYGSSAGSLPMRMGTASGAGSSANLIGMATTNTTTVGNVGAGEDNLMTFSLIANSLSGNGHGVRITAWGDGANNANAKTVKCYFGATAIITTALTTSQADTWRVTGEVIRTAATTQVSSAQLLQGGTTTLLDVENAAPGETLTGAVTIKCTGEATADNDIRQLGMLVEYL